MKPIGDDPIIRCMERSGYPPWLMGDGTDSEQRAADAACGEDDDGTQ